MDCSIDTWKATGTPAGTGRKTIKVIGKGTCTKSGYMFALEPIYEGFYDQPELAALKLVAKAPEFANNVITPVFVEYEFEDKAAVTRLRIDVPGGRSPRAVLVEG